MATFEVLTSSNVIGGGGGGGGTVDSVVAGTGISVDATDPANPIVSTTGASILSATVELTDAQIKTLPSAGITIVEAQGDGKGIIPISCFTQFNIVGAYAGVTGASLQLSFEGIAIGGPAATETALTDTLNNYVVPIQVISLSFDDPAFPFTVVNYQTTVVSGYNNKPLQIGDFFNGLDNYTGGNAANTLKVTVYYVVVDL